MPHTDNWVRMPLDMWDASGDQVVCYAKATGDAMLLSDDGWLAFLAATRGMDADSLTAILDAHHAHLNRHGAIVMRLKRHVSLEQAVSQWGSMVEQLNRKEQAC